MSDIKTKPSQLEVSEYLTGIKDEKKVADAQRLVGVLQKVTGQVPVMWGTSIIGFGAYHYKYASGHEGDAMKIGLSVRKEHLVLYGIIFYDHTKGLIDQLGAYKQGKGCLYIKKVADINLEILGEMVKNAHTQPAPSEVGSMQINT